MSEVNSAAASNVLADLSLNKTKKQSSASSELSQEDFFKLMVTELNNQSPLEPMDNSQMLSQMTDINTSKGIESLNKTMEKMNASLLSSQALQASSMVGRTVLLETDKAVLSKDRPIAGTIQLPQTSANVSVSIYDKTGVLVDQIALGEQSAGELEFVWNGKKKDGKTAVPPGQYTFKATADIDGQSKALSTTLSANVNSVSLDKGGSATLNVNGQGGVSISQVRRII